MTKYLVVVAGNIGVGKTSLTERIGSRLSWWTGYESVADNPYLTDFYGDMRAWSFHLQIFFLGHRADQYLVAARDARSDANDAIEALEAKVGADSSAVTTSHDYKLSSVATGQKAVSTSGDQSISGAKTFTKTVQTITTARDDTTVTFDLSAGNLHKVTLEGNRTLALSKASTGQVCIIKFIQDGTGSRTVTWFSTISWAGDTAPTLTTTASNWDVFGFICTGSNTYDGFVIGQGLN